MGEASIRAAPGLPGAQGESVGRGVTDDGDLVVCSQDEVQRATGMLQSWS